MARRVLCVALVALSMGSLSHATARTKAHEFDVSFASKLDEIKKTLDEATADSDSQANMRNRKLIQSVASGSDFNIADLKVSRMLVETPSYYGGGNGTVPGYGNYGGGSPSTPTIDPTTNSSIGNASDPLSYTPKAVSFSLSFQGDYNAVAARLSEFVSDTRTAIAVGLGLKANQVNITSVRPGSIIVLSDLLLDPTTTATAIATLSAKMTSMPDAIFTPSYTSKFGITSVAVATVSSPPSPTPTPTTNTTTNGTGSTPIPSNPASTPNAASVPVFAWTSLLAAFGALVLASML